MADLNAITTRPMVPTDLEAVVQIDASTEVVALARLGIVEGHLTWSPKPRDVVTVRQRDIGAFMDEPSLPWDEAYVAEVDGIVRGLAAIGMQEWNRRAVLWHFYVDRSVRGRGVGRALIDVLLDRARGRGARQLWLETQDWNTPAIAAYERLGFTLVGFDRSLYSNPPDAETAVYLAQAVSER